MASKANQNQAKRMAQQGKSAAQIERKTGVSTQRAENLVSRAAPVIQARQQTQQQIANTPQVGQRPGETATVYAPGVTPPAQPTQQTAPSINKQNSLGQNLRIAGGANNVLSNKELLKISKQNDKNPERVLEKAVGKGMMIGSGVVNKYQKGKYTDPGLRMARMALPGFAMAAGKDSAILQQLRNAGRQDKGSALFIGSKGSTATTLPRRLGLGEGYRPPGGDNNTTLPTTTETGTTAPETVNTTPVETMLPEEETKMDPGAGMLSGGGMGAAGANKLGRAKSRLRQLGIYGRGTGLLNRGLQYGNALNK